MKKKPKLKNPILVEGLPGIGNVGRVAAGYLISELKMKPFAELYSQNFLPLVILHSDSRVHLLKCEFFYHKGKKRDLIVMTGDSQSISPEGHYDIAVNVLEFAKKLGVKEIITLGGFAEGKEIKQPRVIGAVNDIKLVKKYKKYDIEFSDEHPIGTIVGASGLLLGIGKLYDIDGLCLMGETVGLPLLTDPKAADAVLKVLVKVLDVKVDLGKLEKIIEEMEEKIERTGKIQKKLMESIPKSREDIRYIG
jgi:hypothetical protein